MRIVDYDLGWGYPGNPAFTFDFGRFSGEASDFVLVPGTVLSFGHLREGGRLANERVVYVNFEEPNGFFLPDSLSCRAYEDRLQRILTLCPFTAEWGNTRSNNEQRRAIFFPTNEMLVPKPLEKTIPVVHCGNVTIGHETGLYFDVAKRLGGCTVCFHSHPVITHVNVTYAEKLELIARSKITIVHNLLFFGPDAMNIIKAQPGMIENKAFEHGHEGIAPQLKSRAFEAAFCRSLILCRKDSWNLIEEWFTPDEEFVYFEPSTLEQQVKDILDDFETYQPIIDRAYERAMDSYTTRHFFDRYLRNE